VPLLVGLSLMLHFGLFNLLAAAWRAAGVDVRPLFRSPLASASLRDFWMRRWNIAFSEMCQESVVRVTRPLGARVATVAVFLFSGLAHEVAISLPVEAGYGLPTLYFAIHGVAMLAEPCMFREGSVAARRWTVLLVVVPLPLVFHEPFRAGVVWPIIGVTPW
jgi:alginate O-acetyltransferase complex protein AlgI